MGRTRTKVIGGAAALVALGVVAAALAWPNVTEVLLMGDSRRLRDEREGPPPEITRDRAPLLVLAFDGVGRAVMYDLVQGGAMPALARLLSGDSTRSFPRTYFDSTALTVLPSSTLPAWATIFSGARPAEHGVTGDELFLRDTMELVAPIPISLSAPSDAARVYSDALAGRLLMRPTIYEQMRNDEPEIRIWVSMSQFFSGADRQLLGSRTVIGEALMEYLDGGTSAQDLWPIYAEMSEEVVETVEDEIEELEPGELPEVLTVYFPMTDFVAHGGRAEPGAAQRRYLVEVIDPLLSRLHEALERRGGLGDRFVVAVSDHGHTELVSDSAHAIEPDTSSGPAAVLAAAGFRVRPFELEAESHDYQAVVAYQGAIAFIYLADRSTCPRAGERCRWREPASAQDLTDAASAFVRANEQGAPGAGMHGALDLVLVRNPDPEAARRARDPYLVASASGELFTVEQHLDRHPRPEWIELAERLRWLAAGPYGDRAGDLLLIARSGDTPSARRYFAKPHWSGHGSPSLQDGAIPLIVGHPQLSVETISRFVREVAGEQVAAHEIGALLLRLRRVPREVPRVAHGADR